MSLSGMVEIPCPFDGAQDMLQAKRRSVMPAQSLPPQKRGASIQDGVELAITENLDSRFRGKDGRDGRLSVDVIQFPRLRAERC